MKRLAALLVVPLLALSACGDDLYGTVIDKSYEPPYDSTYMMPMYSQSCSGGYGNMPRTCSQYVTGYIPMIDHHPACYRVRVKGKKSGSECISSERWNSLSIGDDYVGVDYKDKKK